MVEPAFENFVMKRATVDDLFSLTWRRVYFACSSPTIILTIRGGVKMYVPVLIAILVVSFVVFCVWRIVKERAADEMKKATPDPNEFH